MKRFISVAIVALVLTSLFAGLVFLVVSQAQSPQRQTISQVNPAPHVIPSLREWHGASGAFALTPSSRIVIDTATGGRLDDTARIFAADLTLVTGRALPIVADSSAGKGNFLLSLAAADPMLGDEGYALSIADAVTLRASKAFSSRERHEIKAHARVVPQVGNRRDIGGSVVETRHPVLVGHPYPILPADLPGPCVKEVRHRGMFVERSFVLLQGFHLDKTNSAIAEGMVISVAMRLLNNHFALKSSHLGGNTQNGLVSSPGDASCRSQCKRSSSAGSDQSGLALQSLG